MIKQGGEDMSITAETAKEHAKDPAVLCCRAEEGIIIGPENLEDPAIFDDLVDSGLLNLDGVLTIEEILGAKLTKTCDSLTPITRDVIDAVQTVAEEETAAPEEAPAAAPVAPVAAKSNGGVLKIHIGEGKDIQIELPMNVGAGTAKAVEIPAGAEVAVPVKEQEPKLIRSLTRKHFKITEVKRGPETKIEGTTLYIREGIEEEAVASQELVNSLKIDIITPAEYHTLWTFSQSLQKMAMMKSVQEQQEFLTVLL